MDKPTILKGKRISQTNGKIKMKSMANGQQRTNRINQSIRAINVRMIVFEFQSNNQAIFISVSILEF